MSRYTDVDALYKYITNKFGGVDCSILLDDEIAPSIDIVRCKECIFDTDYYFKNDVKEHRYEWCYEFCDADGYCPFGKKRSEREGE